MSAGPRAAWRLLRRWCSRRDSETFQEKAQWEEVKLIEIKVSQGAKPGPGGILPGSKVTEEIAEIRGCLPGQDVISPAGHSAFTGPSEMLEFIKKLRDLSGGKPVGIKICLGRKSEFIDFCKTMVEKKIYLILKKDDH